MKTATLILFAIIFIAPETLFAQSELFYVTVQGNWDKQKQKSRAQFGGDNKLINTYFGNFTRDLLRSGFDARGVGEISFVVRKNGAVDSLVIKKKIGALYDSTVFKILQTMSGKWRPAQVDGDKKDEVMTIWYNIYKGGRKSKKGLEDFITEAKASMGSGDFKKALKSAESALDFDALNADAITIKAQALAALEKSVEACDFLQGTSKYENERLIQLTKEICK